VWLFFLVGEHFSLLGQVVLKIFVSSNQFSPATRIIFFENLSCFYSVPN